MVNLDGLAKSWDLDDGTVALVSHDRHFLRSLVNRVMEIDHGRMRMYQGNYEYYLGCRELG